jgi:hypothetical protein
MGANTSCPLPIAQILGWVGLGLRRVPNNALTEVLDGLELRKVRADLYGEPNERSRSHRCLQGPRRVIQLVPDFRAEARHAEQSIAWTEPGIRASPSSLQLTFHRLDFFRRGRFSQHQAQLHDRGASHGKYQV